MENIRDLLITWLPAIISIVGAIIAMRKVKPEIKKIESEVNKNDGETISAIGDAAESVANAAKITNEQLLAQFNLLIDHFETYKLEARMEIDELKATIRLERQARIEIERKLSNESQARIRAENQINALKGYIDQLKTLMRNANIPVPPPFMDGDQKILRESWTKLDDETK